MNRLQYERKRVSGGGGGGGRGGGRDNSSGRVVSPQQVG